MLHTDVNHSTPYSHKLIAADHQAMLCIRGTSHGPVSVSVSVSVTSRCSIETDEHRAIASTRARIAPARAKASRLQLFTGKNE